MTHKPLLSFTLKKIKAVEKQLFMQELERQNIFGQN
jgi:hypothetical protein